MKKWVIVSLILILAFGLNVMAQNVNVTFRANVATVPDTLSETSVVQVRGTTITGAGQVSDDKDVDILSDGVKISWDGESTMFMKNVGGDYWEGTFAIAAGTKLSYKFFTNAENDTVYPGADWEHRGWEAGVPEEEGFYAGNRSLDLSTFAGTDTVLILQFVNGVGGIDSQYFRPYTETDSLELWFRVNMQALEGFNPDNQTVGVRGGINGAAVGNLSWDTTLPLNQEKKHANAGQSNYNGTHFWSGVVRIPSDAVQEGQKLQYNFVVFNNVLGADSEPVYNEDIGEREIEIPVALSDSTIHWDYFNDTPPPAISHSDRVRMTFTVDMSSAIQNRGFSFGDTLEVRAGYFSTADQVYTFEMKRQGISTFYKGTGTVTSTIGATLDYQYYSYKGGLDYREVYYNFYYEGDNTGEAERRQVLVEDVTRLDVVDTLSSTIQPRRMPQFRNTSVLAQDVLVTLTCDVRPAYYQLLRGAEGTQLTDIQGTTIISSADDVIAHGVAVNGPITGSWANDAGPDWGPHLMNLDNKAMYDDGTHGDVVAGDSIYTIQFQFYKDSSDVVGQEFKFGIGGGDNEGGYGNNHIANIDDSEPTFTMHAQFGSIDPIFYSVWDYDHQMLDAAVEDPVAGPYQFALYKNYPNPFNPTTTIQYELAKQVSVTMTVYDLMGKQVKTLIRKDQPAGAYSVEWDGTNDKGLTVSSGIYLIRIDAGEFVKSQKMMLIK